MLVSYTLASNHNHAMFYRFAAQGTSTSGHLIFVCFVSTTRGDWVLFASCGRLYFNVVDRQFGYLSLRDGLRRLATLANY